MNAVASPLHSFFFMSYRVRRQFFERLKVRWTYLVAGLLLCSLIGLSFWLRLNAEKESVQRWLHSWQSEIVYHQLGGGDPALAKKVMEFLPYQAPSLESMQWRGHLDCRWSQMVPLNLGSLEAAEIQICYSGQKLMWQALQSPLFSGFLFVAFLFFVLWLLRSQQQELALQKINLERQRAEERAMIAKTLAHDIRGPLGALKTLLHLSHDRESTFTQVFAAAVDRVQNIANDLLDRSRLEDVSNVGSSLKNGFILSEERWNLFVQELQLQHEDIQLEAPWRLPAAVIFNDLDETSLFRILSNLVQNALDSYKSDQLKIVYLQLETRGEKIYLTVMDEGCGMNPELLQKIRALKQSPASFESGLSHGKKQGHGLGLQSMIRKILSVHGDYEIESREDVGTQVRLILWGSLTSAPKDFDNSNWKRDA